MLPDPCFRLDISIACVLLFSGQEYSIEVQQNYGVLYHFKGYPAVYSPAA